MHQSGFFENQDAIFEVTRPIESNMVEWWTKADRHYRDAFTIEQQVILGAGHRGLYIQRYALHFMRTDPITVSPFRPGIDDQLEYLAHDGEDGDLVILFKTLHEYGNNLRSAPSETYRQLDRKKDQLTLEGRPVFALVCGPLYRDGDLSAICYGHETLTGLDWSRRVWSATEGILPDRTDKQQPLEEAARVRIRRNTAEPRPGTISARGSKVEKPKVRSKKNKRA